MDEAFVSSQAILDSLGSPEWIVKHHDVLGTGAYWGISPPSHLDQRWTRRMTEVMDRGLRDQPLPPSPHQSRHLRNMSRVGYVRLSIGVMAWCSAACLGKFEKDESVAVKIRINTLLCCVGRHTARRRSPLWLIMLSLQRLL